MTAFSSVSKEDRSRAIAMVDKMSLEEKEEVSFEPGKNREYMDKLICRLGKSE